jgi:ribosomal protein S18 acetylase RimI-like enzyme
MSAVTLSKNQAAVAGHLRPVNVIRDLGAVADLIELCFYKTMDDDGQRYLKNMRRASRDDSFLRWATHAVETVSMPLSGYVWEESGHIVGNVSLVPFRHKGKRIFLVANVAVHPDYRRQGIARVLTEKGLNHARQRGADSIWLHVRDDNPGAISLYEELGFSQVTRRTTWQASQNTAIPDNDNDFTVTNRAARFWPLQRAWLDRVYPAITTWYRTPNWNILKPGLWQWLYRVFVELNLRQWAAVRDGQLHAVAAWLPERGSSTLLWLAIGPDADPDAITTLLVHVRKELSYRRSLLVEIPAGMAVESFQAAGFVPHRTLIWMRADGATHS